MRRRYATAIFTTVVLGSAMPVRADTISASWADPNYALCEDIGVQASGRIDGKAVFTKNGATRHVTGISFATTHNLPHQMSGTIRWKTPAGLSKQASLEAPWFAVIGPAGNSKMLVLPRKGSDSGPTGQTPFDMAAGSKLKITLTLIFSAPGGSCPASFTTDWTIF